MEKTTLVWPHEAPLPSFWLILRLILFSKDKETRARWVKLRSLFFKNLTNIVRVFVFGGVDQYPHVHEETMAIFNGQKASFLANKYRFVKTVSDMGNYRVPRQLLVRPGDDPNLVYKTISSWKSSKIYCKPVSGDNGRGIRIIPLSDVIQAVGNLKEESVFQEGLIFTKEFRYAISWGADEHVRRFCFEKVKPVIIGTGKKALWRLIFRNSLMTLRSKLVTLILQRKSLWQIIPQGETFELTGVANPPRGSFERVITDLNKLKVIDNFMLQFINDLKNFTQVSFLPLLCFDFGIISSSSKFNKKNVVFIECQMPFSALVYFWQHPRWLSSLIYFYFSVFPKSYK